MFSDIPFLFALFAFLVSFVDAQTNHNVGIGDSSIAYFGNWEQPSDPMDIGGHHMETQDPSAYALFSFTGVAAYYVSTKWPYPVTTDVAIDNQSPIRVNLQDPNHNTGSGATVAPGIITGFTGLQNGAHTVRVSVHPGEMFAVLGGFIYTSLDSNPTTPSASPSAASPSTLSPSTSSPSSAAPNFAGSFPTPPSSASSNATSSSPAPSNSIVGNSSDADSKGANSNSFNSKGVVRKLVVGVGIAGGILVAALAFLFMWCCLKRQRENQRRNRYVPSLESNQEVMSPYTDAAGRADGGYHYQPPPVTTAYPSAPTSISHLTAAHTRAPPQLDGASMQYVSNAPHLTPAHIRAPSHLDGASLGYGRNMAHLTPAHTGTHSNSDAASLGYGRNMPHLAPAHTGTPSNSDTASLGYGRNMPHLTPAHTGTPSHSDAASLGYGSNMSHLTAAHTRTTSHFDGSSSQYDSNIPSEAPPGYSDPPDSAFYAPLFTDGSGGPNGDPAIQGFPRSIAAPVGTFQHAPTTLKHATSSPGPESPMYEKPSLKAAKSGPLSLGSTGQQGSRSTGGKWDGGYEQPLQFKPVA